MSLVVAVIALSATPAAAATSDVYICTGQVQLSFTSPISAVPAQGTVVASMSTLSSLTCIVGGGTASVSATITFEPGASCAGFAGTSTTASLQIGSTTTTGMSMELVATTVLSTWSMGTTAGSLPVAQGAGVWLNTAEITTCLLGGSMVTLDAAIVVVAPA